MQQCRCSEACRAVVVPFRALETLGHSTGRPKSRLGQSIGRIKDQAGRELWLVETLATTGMWMFSMHPVRTIPYYANGDGQFHSANGDGRFHSVMDGFISLR